MSKKSSFRSLDAFAKPLDGLRSPSISGGCITVVALSVAGILFVSQLYMWLLQVDTHHSILLAKSFPLSVIVPANAPMMTSSSTSSKTQKIHPIASRPDHVSHHHPPHYYNHDPNRISLERTRLDIFVHVTFPYVHCSDLDFIHDGSSLRSGINDPNSFVRIHGPNAMTKRIPTPMEYTMATTGGISNPRTVQGDTSSHHPLDLHSGCTIRGTFKAHRIGGELSITLSSTTWQNTMFKIQNQLAFNPTLNWRSIGFLHNVTHYIHEISFGKTFPKTTHHPLKDKWEVIDHPSGIAVVYHNVKLIPTQYTKHFVGGASTSSSSSLSSSSSSSLQADMYQLSTSTHMIQPETLEATNANTLPGFVIQYDLSPLEVHHVESRENVFIFLSSLMSIVGGVFVTVGLVSQLLVDSATAVAKKRD